MDHDRQQSLIQAAEQVKDDINAERANEAMKPEAKRSGTNAARNILILARAGADVNEAILMLHDLKETNGE